MKSDSLAVDPWPTSRSFRVMNWALNLVRSMFRSDFTARGDALRAESRMLVARNGAQGRAWEGIVTNAGLLGIDTGTSRAKVVFGNGR